MHPDSGFALELHTDKTRLIEFGRAASEEGALRCPDRVDEQGPIKEEVAGLATGLRYEEAAVAGRSVESAVFVGCSRIVVGAHRITRAEPEAFDCRSKDSGKSLGDLDKTAQGSLVPGRCGVNQNAAANRLMWCPRQEVDSFLQSACGVAAIDRDLGHQRMGEAVRQDVLRPIPISEAICADHDSFGTLRCNPGGSPGSQLGCTRLQSRVRRPFRELIGTEA